ncbi:MAG: hypothetical protein LBC71_08695 [Oscillospiraceae bacterium]|nr:hypothetical protein [Oscillospiraceae bacterium]
MEMMFMDENHEETQKVMLDFLQENNNQVFKPIEFMPARRGFNDAMNVSILVVESPDGFYVNVRERVQNQGSFFTNYVNALVSWLINKEIDYSTVDGLSCAKIHMFLNQAINADQLDKLRKGEIEELSKIEGSISSLIAMETTISNSDFNEIYNLYKRLVALGRMDNLQIAFSANGEESRKYVNNFPLYGTTPWSNFDRNISHFALLFDMNLSLEEFTDQIVNWEDRR